MRIAVLADIHANCPALEAVLEDTEKWSVSHFWFLGDAVGYGPHPIEPLIFIKNHVNADGWVMGNHDSMLADLLLPEDLQNETDQQNAIRVITQQGKGTEVMTRGQFLTLEDWASTNSAPVESIKMNRKALVEHTGADTFWRENFTRQRIEPRTVHQDGTDYVLVHASQFDFLSRYIYCWAREIYLPKEFGRLQEQSIERGCPRVQWYGHTHVPTLVRAQSKSSGGFEIEAFHIIPGETYQLETNLVLVNPGSVGQPRDLDQRASYAILDTVERTVTFRRVPYDWIITTHEMRAMDFPKSLINRLEEASAIEETPEEWLKHYRKARK